MRKNQKSSDAERGIDLLNSCWLIIIAFINVYFDLEEKKYDDKNGWLGSSKKRRRSSSKRSHSKRGKS